MTRPWADEKRRPHPTPVDRSDPRHPKAECALDGCTNYGEISRGLCSKHAARLRRHGSVHTALKRVGVTLEERLEGRIDKRDDGCWIWTGCIKDNGYGAVAHGGSKFHVHRVMYELHVGPIPAGFDLDHLCRVRSCCNPAHLEPVTRSENIRRGLLGVLKPGRLAS